VLRSESRRVLLFGNVSQPPFVNNLLPALRAFERVAEVRLVEPYRFKAFVSTGGGAPAAVPREAVALGLQDFQPQLVICLAGGLYLAGSDRGLFPADAVFAGLALSDPYGLTASLEIAPGFDLFSTQDPQTLGAYWERGIAARRCDPAADPELYRPLDLEKDCDILYYGKWTPYRDELLRRLAGRFRVHAHAYGPETRWSVPTLPPLDSPEELCRALNRARLALEIAKMDDAPEPWRGTWRITNRPQFAAACGVPSLIEEAVRLPQFFEPGVEIETYRSPEELVEKAGRLLSDHARRLEMGPRARERVLRDQTWNARVADFLRDVARLQR
jgi:spore maturation protein CgeB